VWDGANVGPLSASFAIVGAVDVEFAGGGLDAAAFAIVGAVDVEFAGGGLDPAAFAIVGAVDVEFAGGGLDAAAFAIAGSAAVSFTSTEVAAASFAITGSGAVSAAGSGLAAGAFAITGSAAVAFVGRLDVTAVGLGSALITSGAFFISLTNVTLAVGDLVVVYAAAVGATPSVPIWGTSSGTSAFLTTQSSPTPSYTLRCSYFVVSTAGTHDIQMNASGATVYGMAVVKVTGLTGVTLRGALSAAGASSTSPDSGQMISQNPPDGAVVGGVLGRNADNGSNTLGTWVSTLTRKQKCSTNLGSNDIWIEVATGGFQSGDKPDAGTTGATATPFIAGVAALG